jgi:hypothetical protein
MPDDPPIKQYVINNALRDMAANPAMSHEKEQPGLLGQMWDMVPRIGDGHAMGMLRLGGHELTQALAAFPDSNIRPLDEPGVFGNSTPQIVTEPMGHEDYDLSLYAGPSAEQDRGIDR